MSQKLAVQSLCIVNWVAHWLLRNFLRQTMDSTFPPVLPLQHSATHCNTLQLTATHCNSLQRTVKIWTPRPLQYHQAVHSHHPPAKPTKENAMSGEIGVKKDKSGEEDDMKRLLDYSVGDRFVVRGSGYTAGWNVQMSERREGERERERERKRERKRQIKRFACTFTYTHTYGYIYTYIYIYINKYIYICLYVFMYVYMDT